MRYADNPDPNVATSRMDLRFPLTALKQPNTGGKALDDPELQYLLEIEAAALLHARDAIDAEIRRLREQKGRTV
jgi:hypothetical protein